MAGAITTVLTELAEQLTAAGVPADIDPARVEVPGCLVTADRIRSIALDGSIELRAQLHLVVPADATPEALEQLELLLTATLSVVDADGDIELDGYVKTPGGNLPAWTLPTLIYT